MGILGEKMLAAGVVTPEQVAQAHRRQIIEAENLRKKRAREKQNRAAKANHADLDMAMRLAAILGFLKDREKDREKEHSNRSLSNQ